LDPEIELINFETFPVTRRYHGWDGVVEWLVDMSEPFDDFRFELVWGAVYTFSAGKIARVEGRRTGEEALAAAGLEG
jgi:hypothetical protein